MKGFIVSYFSQMQTFTAVLLAALALTTGLRLWLARRHIRHIASCRNQVPDNLPVSMVMGSPGIGFITPARAPMAVKSTSAVQQTSVPKRPIILPRFGTLVSQIARPCTVLCPDLGFPEISISGGKMRKSLLAVMLLCGAALPAMSGSAPADKPAGKSTTGSFTGATANLAPNDPAGRVGLGIDRTGSSVVRHRDRRRARQ